MSRANRAAAWAAGVIALGSFATALPAILGEPPHAHPALRGLAAGTVAWLLSNGACLLFGWKHGRGTIGWNAARLGGPRRPLLAAALSWTGILALAALALLPSAVVGADDSELQALGALLQSGLGWATPVSFAPFALASTVLAFSVGCLLGSARARPPRGIGWLVVALASSLTLALSAVMRVASIPAPVGREALTKALATGLLSTLVAAAVASLAAGTGRRDARLATTAFGVLLTGVFVTAMAIDYLNPSARELLDVRFDHDAGGWSILQGHLEGRPDLHGVFALAPGSRRLELVGVAAGPPIGGWTHVPQRTWKGLAYLAPRATVEEVVSPVRHRELRSRPAEIRLRPRWFRLFDRNTGLRVGIAGGGFAVSPRLRFAVSSAFDHDWLKQVNSMPRGEYLISTEQPQPRYQVELARRWPRSPAPEVIARNLVHPPQVVWIDERAVRFLFVSEARPPMSGMGVTNQPGAPVSPQLRQSSSQTPIRTLLSLGYLRGPQFLGLATYLVDERKWIDQRVSENSVGSEVQLSADRSSALAHCSGKYLRSQGWCRFDLDHLEGPAWMESPGAPRSIGESVLELNDRSTAMLWHAGGTPLHWRLTIFGPEGEALRTVDLEGSTAVRLAGQLEDGSIALTRHTGRASTRNAPTFGWTLEAVDPSTGDFRQLATDLGTFPFHVGMVSRVYLDREGRLLVPTPEGMVDATRGARTFTPTLSSTALQRTRLAPPRPPRRESGT